MLLLTAKAGVNPQSMVAGVFHVDMQKQVVSRRIAETAELQDRRPSTAESSTVELHTPSRTGTITLFVFHLVSYAFRAFTLFGRYYKRDSRLPRGANAYQRCFSSCSKPQWFSIVVTLLSGTL